MRSGNRLATANDTRHREDQRRMTMHVRMMLATAVCAAVAASGAIAAGPPGTKCGTVAAAGHSWLILARDVPCGAAKKLIQTLAGRPIPKGHPGFYGSFLGMRCIHLPTGLPAIACGNGGRKGV